MSTAIATDAGNPSETFDPAGITSPDDAFALLRDAVPPTPAAAPAAAEPSAAAPAPASPEPVAPEGETPPEPAAEPQDDDEPQTVKPGEIPKFRYRPKDFQEAEVMRLVKAEGLSIREATNRVYGQPEPKPTETPHEASSPAVDPYAAEEQRLKDEIAALEKEADEVSDKAGEDVDVKTAMRTTLRIAKAISDKSMALQRIADKRESAVHEAEQAREQQAMTREQADFQKVVEKYPQLGKKGSPERAQFEAFLEGKSQDADYAPIFDSPHWRSIMAREFADSVGLAPAAAAPATPSAARPQPTPVAPRPPSASQVLTTRGATPPGTSFAMTPEQMAREVDTIDDPDVALAMLAGDKAPPPGKRRK